MQRHLPAQIVQCPRDRFAIGHVIVELQQHYARHQGRREAGPPGIRIVQLFEVVILKQRLGHRAHLAIERLRRHPMGQAGGIKKTHLGGATSEHGGKLLVAKADVANPPTLPESAFSREFYPIPCADFFSTLPQAQRD